jgi:hypothetical protein
MRLSEQYSEGFAMLAPEFFVDGLLESVPQSRAPARLEAIGGRQHAMND